MGQLIGFGLIAAGGFTVLITVIMALGGLEIVFKLMIPMSLKFAPTDEQLMAWADIPLSMKLEAVLSNVQSYSEEGYLGAGQMDFLVTLSGESYEDADVPLVPALFIQEDPELDEIQRYVLQAGPLNYPSIFCWVLALGSLGALFISIIFRFKFAKKMSSGNKMEADSTPANGVTNVQVMPLDSELKE